MATNLHPTAEHVGTAGFSELVPSSHKFTVSQATMATCCMMASGVLISPAWGSHSNKQYARFFMPTSMLSTLTVVAVVAVVAVVGVVGVVGGGVLYIPSHEAIAGDGMNIGFAFWVFLYLFGCMRLGAFAPRKINKCRINIRMHSVTRQRRRRKWSAKYKKSIDCGAPRGF